MEGLIEPAGFWRRSQFMFMPQAPLPQKSVPHMPPPHGPGTGSLRDLPACAANVEYCVVRWS